MTTALSQNATPDREPDELRTSRTRIPHGDRRTPAHGQCHAPPARGTSQDPAPRARFIREPGTGTANTLGFINTNDIIWTVGVTVPIFSAGATQSVVRQSKYLWNAGKAGYEHSLRQAEQQARDAYQGVISQIAQVGALKQAVESNRVSLQATEAGYEVGTKTAIDVLSSREQLVQAQTNYSQAKYGYLNDIIALRLAAGNLDRTTIKQINGWLVEPPPPTPQVLPAPPAAPSPRTAPSGSASAKHSLTSASTRSSAPRLASTVARAAAAMRARSGAGRAAGSAPLRVRRYHAPPAALRWRPSSAAISGALC